MSSLPVDVSAFWRDDALAHQDNCFSPGTPQAALGIRMSDECVFAELGEEGNPFLPLPAARRLELNKRYNDKAERIVGLRLLNETPHNPDAAYPAYRRIGEWFGGQYLISAGTEWLMSDIDTPAALEAMLDALPGRDMRAFMLPEGWDAAKRRIYETYGTPPPRLRHVRGPVTLMMSIYGVERLIYLMADAPELAARFSEAVADAVIAMARVADEEAGDYAGGFSFADDDCCLMSPAMYEAFGFPVLKRVFDALAPEPGDARYQHSDSAMEHLLPILGRLNFTGVNFGPTVLVDAIRRHMPRTRIDGCLAPFTFMRNDTEAIIEEVKRDCAMARAHGRGVNIFTAGSINDGSSLQSMRAVMYAIQNFGRY